MARLPSSALRAVWEKLRQGVFLKREFARRLRLLQLIASRILDTVAQTQYYQSLLRLGFAGFWLAAQLASAEDRLDRMKHSQHRHLGASKNGIAQILAEIAAHRR